MAFPFPAIVGPVCQNDNIVSFKMIGSNPHNREAGYIDGLVQDCSNSSTLEMDIVMFYTKPSI